MIKSSILFLYLLAIVTALMSTSSTSIADYVDGYTRIDWTSVEPHFRSSPNSTQQANYGTYGTYGNVNPYTGERGTSKCGLYDSFN